MPDLASRRLARTSWVLFPIDETMPIPVTTTRLMYASSESCAQPGRAASTAARLHRRVLLEQADLEVRRPINDRAVSRQPAVGNAEHQLGTHYPLDVETVDDLLDVRKHLAGELQFAEAQSPTFSERS